MSKFQIHNTDDFLILESENQAISVICFSITKIEDGVLSNLSRRIFNFFDSFGYSYVIQISESSLKLLLIISADNVGEVINRVSTLLDKIQTLGPISPYLMISTTNHMGLAEELMEAYFSPLKKTSESRIIKMANKFWVLSSIILPKENNNEILQYFQDLLNFKDCSLDFSSRTVKRYNKKKLESHKNILISYNSSSFEKSIDFLDQLQKISFLYKDRISLTMRFHSLNEIKRNKILFLLGLTNKHQTITRWDKYLKIERFIPNIQISSKKQIQNEDLSPRKEIEHVINIQQKILQLLRNVKIPRFIRDIRLKQINRNNWFFLFRRHQNEKSTYKIKFDNIKIESKKSKPLVSYGKEVSTEEINELIENIPLPPKQ